MPEEIEVARRTVRRVGPELEEQGALQNKLVAIPGLTQPIEKPLQRVTNEDQSEVLPLPRGNVEELLADRRCEIARRGRLQMRASMYGFITFETRHTLAASHR